MMTLGTLVQAPDGITGNIDMLAVDPSGLELYRVDDHWFDAAALCIAQSG